MPHAPGNLDEDSQSKALLLTLIQSQFEFYASRDFTRAPKIPTGPNTTIPIDNQQRCQYDLKGLRSELSPIAPIVQVVGDSGTPFEDDKIPVVQAILASHVADAAIEYGFTASKYDTNWLVNEYQRIHPRMTLIANLVEQTVEALESGMEGFPRMATLVLLFDRLSPTRFGDDVWLSDGIMSKERGDKLLCFEGGPQALYQCCNTLMRGMQVVAVTNLRSARFSAARFLAAFKTSPERAEEYLEEVQATWKQTNVARWCWTSWTESAQNIASLIEAIDANQGDSLL